MNSFRLKRGFTLIELLVTISIIGLLSSVVLASVNSARDKARIAAGLQYSANLYHTKGADAVGIWNLNEGADTAIADDSGSANNGTITSATWTTDTASTKQKNSLFFNGNSYVDIPYNASLLIDTRGFTYSAWIKPTSLPQSYNMFMGQYLPYFNVRSSGNLFLSFNASGQQTVSGTKVLGLNKWYHVAATVDSAGYATIYLDGKVEATGGPYTGLVGYTNRNFYIGQWESSGTYRFQGNIDEVRFYNHALGIAEIEKLYAESSPKHLSER